MIKRRKLSLSRTTLRTLSGSMLRIAGALRMQDTVVRPRKSDDGECSTDCGPSLDGLSDCPIDNFSTVCK